MADLADAAQTLLAEALAAVDEARARFYAAPDSASPDEIVEVSLPLVKAKDALEDAVRAALAAAPPTPNTRERVLTDKGDVIIDPVAAGPPGAVPLWEGTLAHLWRAFPDHLGQPETTRVALVRAAAGSPPPTPDDPPQSMDDIGRFIAQALADTGLTVGTYGVLADLIHVTTPDGRLYDVTLDEPSGIGDETDDPLEGSPSEIIDQLRDQNERLSAGPPPTNGPTRQQIAELQGLLADATPGPWELTVDERSWEDQTGERYAQIDWELSPLGTGMEWVLSGMDDRGEFDQVRADVKLIAAARNALPDLLDGWASHRPDNAPEGP